MLYLRSRNNTGFSYRWLINSYLKGHIVMSKEQRE